MALINEIKQHYDSFIETAHMAGALDEKTKELIHIAVVLAMKCEPWVEAHLAVARKMGITEEEIAEALHLTTSISARALKAMAQRAALKSEDAKLDRPFVSELL